MCSYYSPSCAFYALFFILTCALVVSAFTPSRNTATLSSVSATASTTSHHRTSTINHESAGKRPSHTAGNDNDPSLGDDDDQEEDNTDDDSDSTHSGDDKNCTCSGSNCLCCVNLNLSFIDLGGPGCVKFDYVAENDSLAVNMSYGGRLLESDTLKRTSNEPICMDLLSDLAQMCAKFTGVTLVTRGVKGCVSIEPLLLGVSQTSYDIGCFSMDIEGIQPQPQVIKLNGTKETTEENEEEELAAAISESASEGFNWFNNFISLMFSEKTNGTSSESIEPHYNRTNVK